MAAGQLVDRPVGEVTRELLGAVGELAGTVAIDPTPQEVPWTVPLDEDAPLRPDSKSLYPATKARAEQAVRDANADGRR